MTVNTINGLICSRTSSAPSHLDPSGCRIRTESSRLSMKRSGEDLEMSATFTSSRSTAVQPATSTLVAAPSFVMIPTATGQFVQPVILPATTAQLGGPLMINGQLTAAAQPFMVNGQQVVNSVGSGGVPRRRIRVIRPGGGGRRGARFRGGGRGGGGGGGRFRRLRGGGGGGRSAPIVIVDSDGEQGRQQVMSQPLIQPIIQPVIQPVLSQQPFVGNPLIQSHPPSVQVPQSVTSISVTASPQTQPAPTLYQTTVTSIQDSKGKNTIGANHGGTVFVPAAPVVNLMMVPAQKPEKSRRQSLRDRRRNRVRTRVKLRLKEWVNTE